MKLEIMRKDFIKSWALAEHFVDTKSPNIGVNGIFVSATEDGQVMLIATDLKTSVKCYAEGVNVIEAGEAVIPVAIFGSMLRKVDTDELTVDVNADRGFLKSGKNKMKFTIISPEQFPSIPSSTDAQKIGALQAELLGQLIAEGGSASSVPQEFPKYVGTCLMEAENGRIKIVSTDGKRLSLSQRTCETIEIDKNLMLPAVALKELGKVLTGYKDKEVQLRANDAVMWFKVEDIEFSVRLVDAQFPQYKKILNDIVQTSLEIKGSDLMLALERIDIIAKTTPAHAMVLSLNTDGSLKMTARSPEKGITSEEFWADITGNSLMIGFNVGYFLDGLRILGSDDVYIEFSGAESQARMKRKGSDDFMYMLMPIRLLEQDKISEADLQ